VENAFLFLTNSRISLSLSSVACSSSGKPFSSASPETIVTLKPVDAVLTEGSGIAVDVVESKIGSKSELREAQFVDADNGWACGRRMLYRTVDGGKNWTISNLGLAENSYVTSLFFTDRNHGWLTVIHKDDTKAYPFGYSSSILTTEDGGVTWTEGSRFRNEIKLSHVAFVNQNKGIAVGGKTIEQDRAEEIFVASTTDGGKSWNDIGARIKPAIKTPHIVGNDFVEKIYWQSSSKIFLLTRRDRVVVSDDSGETWNTVVQFEEENPFPTKSSLYKLLFDSRGRFRVLGGSGGNEGYWSNLLVSDDQNLWHSYKLIRVSLLDAILLSANEILAVGTESSLNQGNGKVRQSPVGIILLSKDNGKTWSSVYRSASAETLISLSRTTETDFYAISDLGNFIKFRLK
jgi:photosystem II stability/assembly factor-like uncharacterized protein